MGPHSACCSGSDVSRLKHTSAIYRLVAIGLIVAQGSKVQLYLSPPSPFLMGIRLSQTFSRFCIEQHCREHQPPCAAFHVQSLWPQIPRSTIAGLEDEVGMGVWDAKDNTRLGHTSLCLKGAPEVGEGTHKPAEGGPSGQGRGENASWALAFAAVGH